MESTLETIWSSRFEASFFNRTLYSNEIDKEHQIETVKSGSVVVHAEKYLTSLSSSHPSPQPLSHPLIKPNFLILQKIKTGAV